MAKKDFDFDETWKQASDHYDKKRFDKCLDDLELLIENSDNPGMLCYIKATVQAEIGSTEEILKELDRSIRFDPTLAQPYQAKAQLLYNTNSDLSNALSNINQAIQNYSPADLSESIGDANSLSGWIQGFVAERSDMINLKTSIESDIRSNQLFQQMQDTEQRIEQTLRDERYRSFEMLGVFAAIIALVLASAQSAANLTGLDFLWLGMGLVLPISFLIILISPRIDNRVKGLAITLSIAVAGGVIGYLLGIPK